MSDTSAARIDAHERGWARVMTLAAGTVTIKATSQGDSGQATLVILPPPPPPPDTGHHSGFTISPALDTVLVGELVTFVTSDAYLSLPTEWSMSDSALARFGGTHSYEFGPVYTRAAGTLTIMASHQGGDTARATLVIREPQPGEWESVDIGGADSGMGGEATAIADDGTIIGALVCGRCAYPPGSWRRGFIYKDGVMRRVSSLDGFPEVIGPSGKIAGGSGSVVSVWDTPDALPRRLALQLDVDIRVVGVNQQGDVLVTGTKRDDGGCDCRLIVRGRAALWRDGVSVNLGSLGDSTVEPWTEATAWNAKGQIVGRSHVRNRGNESGDLEQFFHPFLWENDAMRDLGVLAPLPCPPGGSAADCSWGEAADINANGVIVGTANGADGAMRAVIWENGVIRDLGVDPGNATRAIAINDRGQALVMSWGTSAFQYLLWENGQIQRIDPKVNAHALGPNGEVVGGTFGRSHAVFWQAGQLTDLGEGEALAVNGKGEVVGTSGGRVMLWRKKP